jgi:murein DD-endopeptidase MepM/ murein hydrolase activator NlpD
MKKSYYTVLIVNDKADKIVRYKFSNIVLFASIVFTFLALISAVSMLYNYFNIRIEMIEISSLKEENRMQDDQLTLFEKQYKELGSRLEKLKKTNENISLILNLGPDNPTTSYSGIGGTTNGDKELTKKTDDVEVLASNIMMGMMKFEEESKHREESLQQLLIFLEDQSHLLDSTPSVWPTKGFLCSNFGFRRDPINRTIKMHEGYDIANKLGTPIYVTADGIVAFTGIETGYGNMITVDHGYGITSNYAHLMTILVQEGQRVRRGDKIALMGSTGRSIGSHLHYEVRINGVPVDPGNYILN